RGEIVAGEFRPGQAGREYCHPDVLRTLRRKSLAALRREVEPVQVETLGRFLPAWHSVGVQSSGVDRLAEIVFQLQGCAIPVSALERDVLAVRMRDYRPQLLDQLVSMGDVVWAGRGSLGASDGRVALYLRSDAARLLRAPAELPCDEVHQRLREHLQNRGASFFRDLYYAGGLGDEDAVLDALWDMVWAGEVTNDTLAPLRMLGPRTRRHSRRPLMRLGPPASAGRWSLVTDLLRPPRDDESRIVALAAADPAKPYGTSIPWPEHEGRMARVAGAHVVLDGGELRLYLERGGRSLLTVTGVQRSHLQALAAIAA